jgi:hypothetical protein
MTTIEQTASTIVDPARAGIKPRYENFIGGDWVAPSVSTASVVLGVGALAGRRWVEEPRRRRHQPSVVRRSQGWRTPRM